MDLLLQTTKAFIDTARQNIAELAAADGSAFGRPLRGTTLGAHNMGLLDKILGRKRSEPPSPPPEHAVLVLFAYGSTDLSRLFALEERLEAAIATAGVGEFDGNEVATDGSDGTLYMYGPDADALFAVVRPTLEATDFMRGARVRLRYGPPADGVREVEVVLGT